jgi:ABC-2 type transport system ATP-binding protein
VREKHVLEVSLAAAGSIPNASLAGAFPGVEFQAVSDMALRVESTLPIRVGPLVRFLEDHGAEVTEARRVHPSLEEVFLRITGIEADAMRKEKERGAVGA